MGGEIQEKQGSAEAKQELSKAEEADKNLNRVEQQPNGLKVVGEKLKVMERDITLLIPALATSDLRMNTKDTGKTIEKGELLPESAFIATLTKYIPKPAKLVQKQIDETGLDKAELQSIINNVLLLKDSPEGNEMLVRTLQTKILDNGKGITYYSGGKNTSGDGKFGPTTGLALLNFLGSNKSQMDAYKQEIVQKGANPAVFAA